MRVKVNLMQLTSSDTRRVAQYIFNIFALADKVIMDNLYDVFHLFCECFYLCSLGPLLDCLFKKFISMNALCIKG